GEEIIKALVRSNLFVLQLEQDREWYRYHQLFQEALQEKLLAERGPAAVANPHDRAVSGLAAQGLLDEAIRHALAAGNVTKAAALVEEHARPALNQEHRSALAGWLDLLPSDVRDQRPAL